MMKKLFILLLPLLSMAAMAQESRTHLVILGKDGSKVAYKLEEQPKITFSETELLIRTDLVEVSYPLINMVSFTYETRELVESLRDIKTNEYIGHFVGESLVFPQLEANSSVSLFSPVGQLLFHRTIAETGEYAFPLSYLTPGVYVIKVNDLTYKIVKR